MRCLVTGASGQLGSYLTRLLVEKGESVSVLVRPSSNLWRLDGITEQLQIVFAELEAMEAAEDAICQLSPDAVFHLAWSGVTADTRNRPENVVASVTGSLQLFRIAQAAGCKTWIGIGSQAEYGPQQEILHEGLLPTPDTAYGAGKLAVANLLRTLCAQTGIRYVWLRLLATYGPKDDPRHLIPSLIERLLRGGCPALTAGMQEWDYLYVTDAAEAIFLCAISPEVEGTFNLASGEWCAVRAVAEQIRDLIDPSLPLGIGAIPQSHPTSLRGNIAKLKQAIGWEPRTDLDAGLAQTVDWYRSLALRI